MHFWYPTVNHLASAVRGAGEQSSPRGKPTTELLGVSMQFEMGKFPSRKGMSYQLPIMEAAQILAGTFDLDAILRVAPNVDKSLFTEQAAYGPILKSQLPKVVNALKRDPSTRRAVLYLGNTKTQLTDDNPCTSTLQFLIRAGMIHLVVNMRSWDLVYGFSNDLAVFNLVAQTVASHLSLLPGRVYAMAGSLHIYDDTAHLAQSGSPLFRVTAASPPSANSWTGVVEAAQSIVDGADPWMTVQAFE